MTTQIWSSWETIHDYSPPRSSFGTYEVERTRSNAIVPPVLSLKPDHSYMPSIAPYNQWSTNHATSTILAIRLQLHKRKVGRCVVMYRLSVVHGEATRHLIPSGIFFHKPRPHLVTIHIRNLLNPSQCILTSASIWFFDADDDKKFVEIYVWYGSVAPSSSSRAKKKLVTTPACTRCWFDSIKLIDCGGESAQLATGSSFLLLLFCLVFSHGDARYRRRWMGIDDVIQGQSKSWSDL